MRKVIFLFKHLLISVVCPVVCTLNPCGVDFDWSLASGSGNQWRKHSRIVDIPVPFNDIPCNEDNLASSSDNNSTDLSSLQTITIQDGDGVRFFMDVRDSANKTFNSNLKIILYTLNKEEEDVGVSTCNSSGQSVLSEILSNSNVTVNPVQVAKGHFIIVGDCHTGGGAVYHRCFRGNITVKSNRCSRGTYEHSCTHKGVCITNGTQASYTCSCCPNYIGSFCEEFDGCHGNPCKNGGFCIDITEGHDGGTFQCLCPYGYSGKTCEQITFKCDSQPCKNNGTCLGNQTVYACSCTPGFTGTNCETNINECASNPCIHGICVDGDDGYQCFCSPGYGGNDCQFEYKECDSSPCINGGSCVEQVGSYVCNCGPGYTGNRCQIKIDLCQSNPCLEYKRCVDRGSSYSCECKPGLTGPECEAKFNVCNPNPCLNGATCWSSLSTFFCACRPGFTGEKCQDVFHLEPIPTMTEEHLEVETPTGIQINHLYNVYIAVGTLASAFFIVLLVVGICHCRVHKTYQRFAFRKSRNCLEDSNCKRLKFTMDSDSCTHVHQPSLDNLYDASGLDFADTLEAPLISISAKS